MGGAHALVVGIAAYRHISPLPDTVGNDARDVHKLLTDPTVCAYRPDQAELLLDDAATRERLLASLDRLAGSTDPSSTVFLYLSCHGGRLRSDPTKAAYVLPVDALVDSDESLARTAISGDELSAALRAIPARKVVVIFDCCHAGGIGQPKAVGEAPEELLDGRVKAGLPDSYYEALSSGTGRVILASSRSTESSWVLPGAQNSLFTAHLLKGLGGDIEAPDGMVRIFDLFEYVQPRVTAAKSCQHPVFKGELEDNFAVGLFLGGRQGSVTTTDDGFRYDAYISYVDTEPDATWVWDTLVPECERAGLRIAVSGDVEQPGVARVVSIERGVTQAKRTVAVVSPAHLADNVAGFENTLAQGKGALEGDFRLLPVTIGPVDLPPRLQFLNTLDLAHPRRAERNLARLVSALKDPLPTMHSEVP